MFKVSKSFASRLHELNRQDKNIVRILPVYVGHMVHYTPFENAQPTFGQGLPVLHKVVCDLRIIMEVLSIVPRIFSPSSEVHLWQKQTVGRSFWGYVLLLRVVRIQYIAGANQALTEMCMRHTQNNCIVVVLLPVVQLRVKCTTLSTGSARR